jgi:phosphoglycolate phosphatase-like HAD superfamily hydrolase
LSSRAFVLFDIDGTLIRRAGPHHKRALTEAVRLVTGNDTSLEHIPTQGMLDGELFRLMLKQSGLGEDDVAAYLPELVKVAQQVYLNDHPDDLTDKLCPGATGLLMQLKEAGIPVALVTGNLSAIAWRKMELCGLRSYFVFGAFAEQGHRRADLVGVALADACKRTIVGPATRVSLIGDHPNDIRAARAHAIRAIATATGLSPFEELLAERPDILVRDLTELTLDQFL